MLQWNMQRLVSWVGSCMFSTRTMLLQTVLEIQVFTPTVYTSLLCMSQKILGNMNVSSLKTEATCWSFPCNYDFPYHWKANYIIYAGNSQNVGVIFNHIYELMGVTSGNQYKPVESLTEDEKVACELPYVLVCCSSKCFSVSQLVVLPLHRWWLISL